MKIGTGIVAAHTSSLESATASLYCEGPDLPVCSCPYCSGKELLVAHLLTHTLPQTKSGPFFGTPFPRISGIQIMLRQILNERGKKAFLTGIIFYKRKGGIRPYKAL